MKSVKEIKKEIIEYGRLAEGKNLTPGVSGNISARYGENVIITSSGSANGYLSEDDFSIIDLSGKIVEGVKKPSSEKLLHCEFYKMRPDVNYIIHMHSPYLSSFASAGIALDEPIMAENVFYFGKIPLAEYGLPSSVDLVEKTSKYFKEYTTGDIPEGLNLLKEAAVVPHFTSSEYKRFVANLSDTERNRYRKLYSVPEGKILIFKNY